MATRLQANQLGAQVCDYCHQKPRFPNHEYCSKTCAGQAAANLCNHCHKKPKFQNFEYCSKGCAALANPQVRKSAAGVGQSQASTASKGQTYPKGKNFNIQPQQSQPAIDPMQIAKLIAQQIPQVQALLAATTAPSVPVANTAVPVAAVPVAQAVPATQSRNPFLGGLNNVQAPAANGTFVTSNTLPAAQQLHLSTQPAVDSTACLIPDCEQPVHVDAKGMRTSDYCSKKHREEAVTSQAGLVSPCIMCLTLPQSEADYFCGKTCREDANNKVEY